MHSWLLHGGRLSHWLWLLSWLLLLNRLLLLGKWWLLGSILWSRLYLGLLLLSLGLLKLLRSWLLCWCLRGRSRGLSDRLLCLWLRLLSLLSRLLGAQVVRVRGVLAAEGLHLLLWLLNLGLAIGDLLLAQWLLDHLRSWLLHLLVLLRLALIHRSALVRLSELLRRLSRGQIESISH